MTTLLKNSASGEETYLLGRTFATQLRPKAIVALSGDLGAGKTTFIRGIVDELTGVGVQPVYSPTFTLLNTYPGNPCIYHFDLYRLPRAEEFFHAGFDEYFDAGGICCIEWAEKIQDYLPPHTLFVHLSYSGETHREIAIQGNP